MLGMSTTDDMGGLDGVGPAFALGMRLARQMEGLSVRDMAAAVNELSGDLHVHFTTVSKIERGDRQVSLAEAVVIAEALDSDVYGLIRKGRSAPLADMSDAAIADALGRLEPLLQTAKQQADAKHADYKETAKVVASMRREVQLYRSEQAERAKSDG
jgi:transcriptional regulator with XRE-family HTH domain